MPSRNVKDSTKPRFKVGDIVQPTAQAYFMDQDERGKVINVDRGSFTEDRLQDCKEKEGWVYNIELLDTKGEITGSNKHFEHCGGIKNRELCSGCKYRLICLLNI